MILIASLLLVGQVARLAPVSDAAREPGFPAYLKKLKSAVAKRDPKALRKLVSSDIITGGFGPKDERGWDKFSQRWEVDSKDSPVWDVLADLADLGVFREAPRSLVSPYLAWKFPANLDPKTHLVVLRDALPLYEKPDRTSRPVATLAFDIVKRVEAAGATGGFDWVLVETLAGIRGYVQSTNVRSPLMSRAQFANENGQWSLVVLDRGVI